MNPFFTLQLGGTIFVLILFAAIVISCFLPAFERDPDFEDRLANAKVFVSVNIMLGLSMLLFIGIPVNGSFWSIFDVYAWLLNLVLPPVAGHTGPTVSSVVFAIALVELLPVSDSPTRTIELFVFLAGILTLLLSISAVVISYARIMPFFFASAVGLNTARRVDSTLALQSLPVHVRRLRRATIAVLSAAFIFVANIAAIVMIAL